MNNNYESHAISRRSFLKASGVVGAAGILAAFLCSRRRTLILLLFLLDFQSWTGSSLLCGKGCASSPYCHGCCQKKRGGS